MISTFIISFPPGQVSVPQDCPDIQAVCRAAVLPQSLRLRHEGGEGRARRRHQDQDDPRGGRRGQDHPEGHP